MPAADQPEHPGRECIGCHREFPDEEFVAGGSRCKGCAIARRRKMSAQELRSYVQSMVTDARYRSKKGGIEFVLTPDDVMQMWAEQDGRCALSGMPLTHHRRGSGSFSSPSNASLDRVAPTGPYSAENAQLVCIGVNLMRRKMELDEFVSWCRQVADHQTRFWRE